jgi:hypothetical protein
MPSPTPPEKVLAAARKFTHEKFARQHRYAIGPAYRPAAPPRATGIKS